MSCQQKQELDRHRPRYQCFILRYEGLHPRSWFDQYGFLAWKNIRSSSSIQILSHSVNDNHKEIWRVIFKLNQNSHENKKLSFSRERLLHFVRQFNDEISQNSMFSYVIRLTYVSDCEPYWGSIVINPRESLESIFFRLCVRNSAYNKEEVLTAQKVLSSIQNEAGDEGAHRSLSVDSLKTHSKKKRIKQQFPVINNPKKKSMVKSKMFLLASEKHTFHYQQQQATRALLDVFASSKHLVEKMGLQMLLTSSSLTIPSPNNMVLILKTKLSLQQFEKIIDEYNDHHYHSIRQNYGFSFKMSDPWIYVIPVTQKMIFDKKKLSLTYDYFVHVLWGSYSSLSYFAPDISQIVVQYEVQYSLLRENNLCKNILSMDKVSLMENHSSHFLHHFIIFSREFLNISTFQIFKKFNCKQCLWRALSVRDVTHTHPSPLLEMQQKISNVSCLLKIKIQKKSGQRISFQTFLRVAQGFLYENTHTRSLELTVGATTHPVIIMHCTPTRVWSDKDKDFQSTVMLFDSAL